MEYVDHAANLTYTPEAISFTSANGAAELKARLSLQAGLIVGVMAGGNAHEFRFEPAQADALGRWLVAAAAEYRGAGHSWVIVPVADAMSALGELAGHARCQVRHPGCCLDLQHVSL